MDKYKKLVSNTLIFAIGTFSSKVLVFLLVPFYTRVLTPSQLGDADLIVKTANLIIPISSIGMANAIIRFGLDHTVNKRDVFTSAITSVAAGYLLFLFAYPLLNRFHLIDGNAWLVYLYVLTACMRSACSQFVRARQLVRLYAFDGVLSTIMVILFNVTFLVVFRLGITGYVLATICSDLLSSIFLFTTASLGRYLHFRGCDWSVLGSMVRYAIPLIPTTVFWWVTNASDAYFIKHYIGADANGFLTIAYKVPTIINLVSGIFTDAWQMSAFTENSSGRTKFFSNVFNAYQSLIFTAASGLIVFARPINAILASKNYEEAWRYIPLLLLATSFSCFVTFLGSIYMMEKKGAATLITTAAGAILNLILNAVLIPIYGVNGGAFATFSSYLIVFFIRLFDTHKYVPMHWKPLKLALNLGLLLTQTWVLLTVKDWILPEIGLCTLVLIVNLRQVLININRIIWRRLR